MTKGEKCLETKAGQYSYQCVWGGGGGGDCLELKLILRSDTQNVVIWQLFGIF